MLNALAHHWPEFAIDGSLIGLYLFIACNAVVILNHPGSPVARAIGGRFARRVLMGVLMGLTAVAIIYSPWGQRSGAHMNPGITLTYLALGKVRGWDALFYIASQFLGAFLGVRVAIAVLGLLLAHQSVNYAATVPGKHGPWIAWIAEGVLAFSMMTMVLWSTNRAETAPYTGLLAGLLVASFIVIEAPISGTSINPARTLGSALPARAFRGLWIYFTAPPLAMLAAAALFVAVHQRVYCCKMHHGDGPCIFNCGIAEMPGRHTNLPPPRGIQHCGASSP